MSSQVFRIHSIKPISPVIRRRKTTVQDKSGNHVTNIARIVITLEGDKGEAQITLNDGTILNTSISDVIAYEELS